MRRELLIKSIPSVPAAPIIPPPQTVVFQDDFIRQEALAGTFPDVNLGPWYFNDSTDGVDLLETILSIPAKDMAGGDIIVDGVVQCSRVSTGVETLFASCRAYTQVDFTEPWVLKVGFITRELSAATAEGSVPSVRIWEFDTQNRFRINIANSAVSGTKTLVIRSEVAGVEDRHDHDFSIPAFLDTDILVPVEVRANGTTAEVYLNGGLVYTVVAPGFRNDAPLVVQVSETGSQVLQPRGIANLSIQQDPVTPPPDVTALEFDGVDQLVELDSAQVPALTTVSVSAWIKPDLFVANAAIVTRGDVGASGRQFELRYFTSEDIVAFRSFDGTDNLRVDSLTKAAVGSWTHVVGVYDGTEYKIYLDGVLDNTRTALGGLVSSNGKLCVGAIDWAGAYYTHFDGQIDDVRVYDRALTDSEVITLANNRGKNVVGGSFLWYLFNEKAAGQTADTIVDYSGTGRDGTALNAPVYVDSVPPVLGTVAFLDSFQRAGALDGSSPDVGVAWDVNGTPVATVVSTSGLTVGGTPVTVQGATYEDGTSPVGTYVFNYNSTDIDYRVPFEIYVDMLVTFDSGDQIAGPMPLVSFSDNESSPNILYIQASETGQPDTLNFRIGYIVSNSQIGLEQIQLSFPGLYAIPIIVPFKIKSDGITVVTSVAGIPFGRFTYVTYPHITTRIEVTHRQIHSARFPYYGYDRIEVHI